MAQDDMHVVMYKILAYLYKCMKEGVKPERGMYSADAVGINEAYWQSIMVELSRRQLVKGFDIMSTSGDDYVTIRNPRITMDGVEFLMENSMMRKAFEFLRDTKSAIPFI